MHPQLRTVARLLASGTAVVLFVGAFAGCTTARRVPFSAERYRLDLRLDPATHEIMGQASIDLSRWEATQPIGDRPIEIEFHLHPGLRLTSASASGADVIGYRVSSRPRFAPENADTRTHVIRLRRGVDSFSLFLGFRGSLYQEVEAGERAGEIHNFEMSAHIGDDGIYLSDGAWYPSPALPADALAPLTDFTIIVEKVDGFELESSGQYSESLSEQTGRLAWRSPFPLPNAVLVGGRHEVHRTVRTAEHGDVSIKVQLKASQADHATGLSKAVERIFDRYEPLIGPYPAKEFSIVDNFFSSGFAFPTFTLLSSAVIDMGKRAQDTHGYLDHEILHSWWGNGVLVDSRDGNWCESLTSYATNYYGHVLDGNESEARRKRRNYSHFLSRLSPKKDRPLGTFGQTDGCGRFVAYQKGAMVFHMLARKLGQEAFWSAMRRFTKEYVGRYASWRDIKALCERQGGESLDQFFRQWVRSGGAPSIRIDEARYDSTEQVLLLDVYQGEPAFEIDLPVRVYTAKTSIDFAVPMRAAREQVRIPLDVMPVSVEADPDYHILRKISSREIIPTTAVTRRKKPLVSIVGKDEVPKGYLDVRENFAKAVGKARHIEMYAGDVQLSVLNKHSVLVLGDGVRDPSVAQFLREMQFPVTWTQHGFVFDGRSYVDPSDAVLCTARHPSASDAGVTVVYANSASAIPKASYIPMYEHSTVIFQNGRPAVRADDELRVRVEVERF